MSHGDLHLFLPVFIYSLLLLGGGWEGVRGSAEKMKLNSKRRLLMTLTIK
jgi:hypothetical protein